MKTPPMTKSLDSRLQQMLDRQDILDCIHRYARGVDRHDPALIESCYHEDAHDEHGRFRGGREAFIRWVDDYHAENTLSHTHNITTHNCELQGDVAHTETYCFYVMRRRERKVVGIGVSRYIDRLERRSGVWKIALRKTVIEWRAEADATVFDTPTGYPCGVWDMSDPSYDRPLSPTRD